MRIGINASFLRKPGTGIGQVTLRFLEQLSHLTDIEGHEFFLYLEEDCEVSFLPKNFVKRIVLPWWKRDDLPRKWWWEKYTLPKCIEKDKIDVFLSLYQSATILPSSMKHIMVVHDLIPRFFTEYRRTLRQRLYWKGVEKAIKSALAIVAVSRSTQDDLVEFGIEREKITLAYPALPPLFSQKVSEQEKNRVREKYSLPTNYIYHGGGLEIRKNAERLLRAYKKLLDRHEKGIVQVSVPELIVSGKIFPKENKLATCVADLVVELQLEGKVRFLGYVPEEDLPALYALSLFFVYPSLYEGFGIPVLEALSQETPVLISDVSSLPEVGGEAALYIDPLSVDSIASGMERLLTDESVRSSLKSHCTEQLNLFHWEDFTLAIFELIKK